MLPEGFDVDLQTVCHYVLLHSLLPQATSAQLQIIPPKNKKTYSEVNRDGTLVIRPDSGNPEKVVVQVLEILGQKFGYSLNSLGFKVLPPYLRLIQGDGVNLESLSKILENVKAAGWSTINVSFGSGGALLQRLNRDTQKCAFKCSHAVINGKQVDVCKHPITDPQKHSKKGRLCLQRSASQNGFVTMEEGQGDLEKDLLVTVFENGRLLVDYILEEEFADYSDGFIFLCLCRSQSGWKRTR
ncbi:Nicotinamide phosphoribosyltransferase [Taenia crassiceps]|uniref:Nicotinamide phosphoribosyltransferase n=1 Tax=Taenia crassiceps TaxID=6207 RepID=A0ABR4QP91_9CEST